MINLIRMNLLRVFQMKCIYIMLLVCMGIAFVLVTESQDTSTVDLEQQVIEEQQTNSSQVGIVMKTENEGSTLCWYLAQFDSSGFLVIFVGIFMSLLACSEHDSGFLKNLASCSQHKWQIVVARLLPGFLCSIILQIGIFLSLILANMVYGSPLLIGNVVELLPVLGVQVLLHTAFAAFVLFIAEIVRNLIASMIISIFTGFGFAGLITSFFAPILTNYMILSRIKMTALPLEYTFLPVTLIVGVISLIGYTILSGFIFQKRDTY